MIRLNFDFKYRFNISLTNGDVEIDPFRNLNAYLLRSDSDANFPDRKQQVVR